MLALSCGILLGCALDVTLRKATVHAPAYHHTYQFLPNIFAVCAATLLLLLPLFYDAAEYARALAAAFAGAQLPRLLTLLSACAPVRIQAFLFASAHALAEIFALATTNQGTGLKNYIYNNSDLLLGIIIAALGMLLLSVRRLHGDFSVDALHDMPQNQNFWAIATLMGVVLLFFLLHATHDYTFRLYSSLSEGPPVWLKIGLRLAFPALALIVAAWGLLPLAAVSVAMSALAPALVVFNGNTVGYWGVFVVDTIGLHGGLLFFLLAFGRVARQNPYASLLRSLPFFCMYVTFGSIGILNENMAGDSLHMLVVCLVILGVQVALMVCMQSQWSSMLRLNDHASSGIEESAEAVEALSEPNSEAAVEAFALAHCISARETHVLHLICKGMSNAQIAEHLFVSENTIKIHVGHILKKTDSKSRTQLVCKLFAPQRQGVATE